MSHDAPTTLDVPTAPAGALVARPRTRQKPYSVGVESVRSDVAALVEVAPQAEAAPAASRAFLDYVHSFRGLAILFIVAIHCYGAFDWSGSPRLGAALLAALGNGSVLFVFIAGFLFQHNSHKFRPARFIHSKLRNVIAPYLVWSVPALVMFTWISRRPQAPDYVYHFAPLLRPAVFLATGTHLAPFWFIPMIALFYVAAPLLVWWDRHPRLYWLILPLTVVGCICSRGEVPWVNAVHYVPVYLLGMCVSHHRGRAFGTMNYGAPALAFAALALAAWQMRLEPQSPMWLNYVQKVVVSVVLLYAFWGAEQIGLGRRAGVVKRVVDRILGDLATVSFGVFFVHGYIVPVCRDAGARLNGHHRVPGTPLFLFSLIVFTVAVSCAAVAVIRTLTGRYSRLLVGA